MSSMNDEHHLGWLKCMESEQSYLCQIIIMFMLFNYKTLCDIDLFCGQIS